MDKYDIYIYIIFLFPQQYGNKIGKSQFQGKVSPTYVFPECLKATIREILMAGLRDYPNPKTSAVSLLFREREGGIAFFITLYFFL